MDTDRPKVGVGVIIVCKKKVLLIQRSGAHGVGSWAFVGGHLEYGETVESCAKREVWEEMRIKLGRVECINFTNDIFIKEKRHYVTLFVLARVKNDNFTIREPEKITKADWFEWNKFPKNLFVPVKNFRRKFRDFKI